MGWPQLMLGTLSRRRPGAVSPTSPAWGADRQQPPHNNTTTQQHHPHRSQALHPPSMPWAIATGNPTLSAQGSKTDKTPTLNEMLWFLLCILSRIYIAASLYTVYGLWLAIKYFSRSKTVDPNYSSHTSFHTSSYKGRQLNSSPDLRVVSSTHHMINSSNATAITFNLTTLGVIFHGRTFWEKPLGNSFGKPDLGVTSWQHDIRIY